MISLKLFTLSYLLIRLSTINAQENLLVKSDNAFFPTIAKFECTLKNYEGGEYKNYYDLITYMKGNRKYLAYTVDPPIARRESHLRVDNEIWIYLGKIKKSTRISAKANFSGSTFTEEDILSTSLAYYYNLTNVQTVNVENRQLIKLTMLSKSDETAYKKIESFIDENTYLPVTRYYYSYSNQRIKELNIKDIVRRDGKLVKAKFVMKDLLRQGVYTELYIKNVEYLDDLPDRMFTKKYMEIASE